MNNWPSGRYALRAIMGFARQMHFVRYALRAIMGFARQMHFVRYALRAIMGFARHSLLKQFLR